MTRPHSKRTAGFAVYASTLFLILIVPMLGLAIDSTLLYVVKTRLQGAVDGAALAGAKALSQGSTETAQETAATNAAQTYVRMNYPSSFFFSGDVAMSGTGLGVSIDTSVSHQRTVTVTASVAEPTLFMRWLSFTSTTVVASASTIRRDLNLILVMDRSSSLQASGTCAPLLSAAENFVGQFSPGHDQLGLVTFATTTNVNFAPATNFETASVNILTALENTTCNGSTSTAMGLWTGYQQLIALNQPTSLNVLVLFTDGEPTGVNVNMPVANSSSCSAYTSGNPTGPGGYTLPSTAHGYISGMFNTFTNQSSFWGMGQPTGSVSSTTAASVLPGSGSDTVLPTNSTGCSFASGGQPSGSGIPGQMESVSDFTGLPNYDVFGNSLNSSYMSVTTNSTGMIDLGTGNGQVIQNAQNMAFNAADDAATRIRHGATDNTVGAATNGQSLNGIIIYTIGLQQSLAGYPFSSTFLERVANDPASPIYDSTYPTGKFFLCTSAADLNGAFSAVASEVLRLAK
jgi:hypothetical protein